MDLSIHVTVTRLRHREAGVLSNRCSVYIITQIYASFPCQRIYYADGFIMVASCPDRSKSNTFAVPSKSGSQTNCEERVISNY